MPMYVQSNGVALARIHNNIHKAAMTVSSNPTMTLHQIVLMTANQTKRCTRTIQDGCGFVRSSCFVRNNNNNKNEQKKGVIEQVFWYCVASKGGGYWLKLRYVPFVRVETPIYGLLFEREKKQHTQRKRYLLRWKREGSTFAGCIIIFSLKRRWYNLPQMPSASQWAKKTPKNTKNITSVLMRPIVKPFKFASYTNASSWLPNKICK